MVIGIINQYAKFVWRDVRKHTSEIGPLFVFITAGSLYAVFNIGFSWYENFIYKPVDGRPLKLHTIKNEEQLKTHETIDKLRAEIGDFEELEKKKRPGLFFSFGK